MNESIEPYRSKALEALSGAQSELANGRFNNAASRAYYGAYDAAIVALRRAGLTSRNNQWSHEEVQARFAGELIRRRKFFSADLARMLYDLSKSRIAADYTLSTTSRGTAVTAVDNAMRFVAIVLKE